MIDQRDNGEERQAFVAALGKQRKLLVRTVRRLSEEQLRLSPTASALCLGGVITHVAVMERNWARFIVEGPSAIGGAGADGPGRHDASFAMRAGETMATLLDFYAETARSTDQLVLSLPSLDVSQPLPDAPWFEEGASWSARRVLLHVLAETAQHAGHADIIRETIDGAKTRG
jgi:uncharacterized damage-inducible protein DinB